MGKSSGSAPQAPDPAVTIPLQAQYNQQAFDKATQASRYDTVGPTGTQTWTNTPSFDQNAYDAAMAKWNGSGTPGTPGTPAGYVQAGQDGYYTPGTPGTPGTAPNPSQMPDRSQFQTDNWTLTNTLSAPQQAILDSSQSNQLQRSQMVGQIGSALAGTVGQPFNPNAPGLTGSISTGQLQTNMPNAPNLQAPTSNIPQQTGAVSTPQSQILDNATGLSGQIGQALAKLQGLDPTQFNKAAADSMYNQQTQYLNQQNQQDQRALEARLAEQGFVPGTPGYLQAMQNFQDTSNRAYSAARDSAVMEGAQVGQQQFSSSLSGLNAQIGAALNNAQFGLTNQQAMSAEGLNLANFQSGQNQQQFGQGLDVANLQRQQGLDANTVAQNLFSDNTQNIQNSNQAIAQQQQLEANAGQFGNTARAQAIAEALQQREVPLQDYIGLTNGTMPNTNLGVAPQGGVPGVAAPDVLSATNAAYQGQLNAYNAQVGSDNATTQGLGSLAMAAAMFF